MMTEGEYQFIVGCYIILFTGVAAAFLVSAIKAVFRLFKKDE